MTRSTYTYVELEVSQDAYDEIAGKLKAAGYDHAFGADGAIDMHGIAITSTKQTVVLTPGRSFFNAGRKIGTPIGKVQPDEEVANG